MIDTMDMRADQGMLVLAVPEMRRGLAAPMLERLAQSRSSGHP
jgi:hypothetical protein